MFVVPFSSLTARTWYPVCISEKPLSIRWADGVSFYSTYRKKRTDICLLQGVVPRVTDGEQDTFNRVERRVNSPMLPVLMQLVAADRLINAASAVSNHCLDWEYFDVQTYDIVDNGGSKYGHYLRRSMTNCVRHASIRGNCSCISEADTSTTRTSALCPTFAWLKAKRRECDKRRKERIQMNYKSIRRKFGFCPTQLNV